jgi:hypothetical protein
MRMALSKQEKKKHYDLPAKKDKVGYGFEMDAYNCTTNNGNNK